MNAEITLGKYHYWDENLGDNIKRFHFFEDNNGKDVHIDFSPYHHPSEEELEAVREIVEITGVIPHRGMNDGGGNFHVSKRVFLEPDIIVLLKEIKEDLCPCGNFECEEKYEHTTSGY